MKPVVSVRLITFNHKAFIEQSIESVLMQKVNFPYEIIIGDDFSQDGTREIVLDYQRQYPGLIQVLPTTHNTGGRLIAPLSQQASQGKYQAMLEGDDYWIDPRKLQKQVDFLEAHPEMSLCYHNAFILSETQAAARLFFQNAPEELASFETMCNLTTHTGSVMARSVILATLPEWRTKIWCGDVLFRLWCAHHGPVGYLNDIMSVYRVHSDGMVSGKKDRRKEALAEELFMYTQLDVDTQFQHTAALQQKIKQTKKNNQRYLKTFYLSYPAEIWRRFRQFWLVYKRFKTVKDFGNQL